MIEDDALAAIDADAERWLLAGNSTLAKPGEKCPRLYQLVLWNCPIVGPYNLRRLRRQRSAARTF